MDTPDPDPDSVPEDLTVNDIESIVEFVLEDVMDIKNAIAEHDEPDEPDGGTLDMKKIDFYFHRNPFVSIRQPQLVIQQEFTDHKDYFYSSQYIDVLTQPPKA